MTARLMSRTIDLGPLIERISVKRFVRCDPSSHRLEWCIDLDEIPQKLSLQFSKLHKDVAIRLCGIGRGVQRDQTHRVNL